MLKLGGEVFEYEISGPEDADVIVFSNSLGTTLSLWDVQSEELSTDFRVLRYDTRGHGGSVKSKGPYTFKQLGTDVLNLVDALGIEHFSFCGISMGGLVGQWLGINAEARIDKLILCNTAARLGTAEAWLERAGLVRLRGMVPVVKGTPGRWFTPRFLEMHAELAQQRLNELSRTDAECYAACCEALANADFRHDVSSIKAPTLVIGGMYDPVTTLTDADFLAQRIPGAACVSLEASHLSNLEAADVFTLTIRKYLEA